jgi:predicted dehydrogenase
MARWNRSYELCGGLWIHKGSHDFDVFNWLLGFPKPVKVSAFAGVSVLTPENIPFEFNPEVPVGPTCHECPYSERCPDCQKEDSAEWTGEAHQADKYAKDLCIYTSEKDVHDNGIAMVEYENGVRASHLECFITPISDRRYTVVGDRGQAEVSLTDRTITVRPRWKSESTTYNIPSGEGGHGGADPGLVDAFVTAISENDSGASNLSHGMLSTAIGQAAELSRREERMVYMSELLD